MTGAGASRVRCIIDDGLLVGERRLQVSVWNDFTFAPLCWKGPQFLYESKPTQNGLGDMSEIGSFGTNGDGRTCRDLARSQDVTLSFFRVNELISVLMVAPMPLFGVPDSADMRLSGCASRHFW